MGNHDHVRSTDIAIVGMNCRVPGANDTAQFWSNLKNSVESTVFFDEPELRAAGVPEDLLRNPHYVRAGTKIDNIGWFDAAFFGFSAKEAELMDPQQRLFLETAWEALEIAGYDPFRYEGLIGVYAGIGSNGYIANIRGNNAVAKSNDSILLATSNEKDFVATNTSYKLNLRGPSVNVQTACSTSLVAIHIACQALLAGECDMALAGGVSINVPLMAGYLHHPGGILSPDGHCRAFDASAQGTFPGSGVGIVLMKPLGDALSDGDQIYAVIRGSAINNDGFSKVSFMAPSLSGQAAVIRAAQAAAEVEAESISYVETHGTGTALGDPIEIAALTEAFRSETQKTGFCAVGSLKTNIGHLNTAAGIMGLIKTTLALKHRQIPASLNFNSPNPEIDFESSPFFVNAGLREWTGPYPLRAGVSAFGLGGTNAHVVLEEAPAEEPSDACRSPQLLVLSAKTESALQKASRNLAAHLRRHPEANLADVAYTLQVGRAAFPYRQACVCTTAEEAIAVLDDPAGEKARRGTAPESKPGVVFLFPGQVSQLVHAGWELHQTEAVFQRAMAECCEAVKPILATDLRAILYPGPNHLEESRRYLENLEYLHPALFALEYSLAQLWMHWGVKPQAVVGYGVGEYVAACIAGVMSMEDALPLLARRGRLLQKMSQPFLPEFAKELAAISMQEPKLPYFSSLTGMLAGMRELTDADYWIRHAQEPVRFREAVTEAMRGDDCSVFLEVGPGRTLSSLARLACRDLGLSGTVNVISSMRAVERKPGSLSFLLEAAGKLWLAGVMIDWQSLHSGSRRKRVSLPTYPFERQRYWIDAASQRGSSEKTSDAENWFYLPSWKQSSPLSEALLSEEKMDWLVFSDNQGIGEEIGLHLRRSGQRTIMVRTGDRFFKLDDDTYSLHPQRPKDYQSLFANLLEKNHRPQRIVYLWGVTEKHDIGADSSLNDPFFTNLLILVKAMGNLAPELISKLAIIADEMLAVTGEEQVCPRKAALLAMAEIIPREILGLVCRSIDVRLPVASRAKERLSRQILAEVASRSSDAVVAYRGQQRWIRSFEPVVLEEEKRNALRLGDHGVYLIIGDIADVGIEIAEHLWRTVKARLVLMSRDPFPPREDWGKEFNGKRHEDARARCISRIEAMYQAGAEILFLPGENAHDSQSMQAAVHEMVARFGPIQGVIHAVSSRGGSHEIPMKSMEPASWEEHLKLNPGNLRALAEPLFHQPLDFYLMLSRVAGGHGLERAACLYVDSVVQNWQQENPFICASITLDFPGGHSLEQAANETDRRRIVQQVFSSSFPQMLVSATHPRERLAQNGLPASGLSRASMPPRDAQLHSVFGTDYVPPRGKTEGVIAGIWQELLGVPAIGRFDNFFRRGGNSLVVMMFLARLRKSVSVNIPLRAVFEFPTVNQLAELIESQTPGPAKSHSRKTVQPARMESAWTSSEGVRDAQALACAASSGGQQHLKGNGLERRIRPERVCLSYAQQRLWFIDQLEGGSTEYNMPQPLRLSGKLDVEALRRAVETIVERHESLRTRFREVDGEPIQIIEAKGAIEIPIEDLSGLAEGAKQEYVAKALRREWEEGFDLERGPLLRMRLLRLSEREHMLLRTFHHIVSDGWSVGVFNREFMELYAAFHQGRENPLEPLPLQYGDFALWQREWLNEERMQEHLEYWKEQLAGIPEELELARDRERSTRQSFAADACRVVLAEEQVEGLKKLGQAADGTLYMTLLAGFAVLLGRYSGKEDIVVGSPIANRQEIQLEKLIGFFVNSLVLRVQLKAEKSFPELLHEVRRTVLQAYEHQDLPFERLVEAVAPERSLNRTPIYQVMFAFQNTPLYLQEPENVDLKVEATRGETAHVRFDLELHAREEHGEIEFYWVYNRDLFDGWRIEQMARHYCQLLQAAVACPDMPLWRLEILRAEEREQLLKGNNATERWLEEATIPELFESRAAARPEADAVVEGKTRLSYRELNERSNQLAHYLMNLGVGPEVTVGVCVERSWRMVVAVLGVVKAGGAYLPLDPEYPAQRLEWMVQNAAPVLTICSTSTAALWVEKVPILKLDSDEVGEALREMPKTNPGKQKRSLLPDHPVYVMYTSGSTGRPKGIVMPTRALLNLVKWQIESMSGAGRERVAQFTGLSFDVSAQEIFSTLGGGGALYIVSNEMRRSPEKLVEWLDEELVEELSAPLLVLEAVVEAARETGKKLKALKGMNQGGEALIVSETMREFCGDTGRRLRNHYGPSETHVATAWELGGDAREWPVQVPIGRPIWNTKIYVVDQWLQPAPVGVIGDLYIGGAGMARGYVRSAVQTAERFVANPFADAGERMYRTGDLVRWQPGGVLEFIGRADHQVKIRGCRVELGEIETTLTGHPGVKQAAVIALEENGEKRLVGYVVAEATQKVDRMEVRRYAAKQLPEYMVPEAVVVLESLPLTVNGKLDRKALPQPEWRSERYQGPRTLEEQVLCEIFAVVLGRERVGIDDDLFDLGGHSLLAVRVISRIRTTLGKEIPVRAIFESPTVAGLARILHGPDTARPVLSARIRPEHIPLSYAQQRLWFLDQLEGGSEYNMPEALRLVGPLDVNALTQALNAIVGRHESLRTRFVNIGGTPAQIVDSQVRINLPVEDLAGLSAELQHQRIAAALKNELEDRFDLAHGPVLRVKLMRLGEQEHVLLRTFHHIAFDGWSMGIFNHELEVLYEAFHQGRPDPLGPLPVQYADFSIWQREWLSETAMGPDLEYWRNQLRGIPEQLVLPRDRPRPAIQTFAATRLRRAVPADLVNELKTLGSKQKVSLYMTLLSVFALLMQRYSGENDVVAGSAIANRQDPQLYELIGFFVNSLVMRIQVNSESSFQALLMAARATALGAYEHQDLPFERLVEELAPQRNLSFTPLYQVSFDLPNFSTTRHFLEQKLHGLKVDRIPRDEITVRCDLEVHAIEQDGWIDVHWVYNNDLFDEWRIHQMAEHYQNLLSAAVSNPDIPVHCLPMMAPAERQMLLDASNGPEFPLAEGSVVAMFEAQVERTPNALAISCGDAELSYRMLNARANHLARYLIQQNIPSEKPVGIAMERSIELVVALLAVLKSGGALLPLAADNPEARFREIVADANPAFIFTNAQSGPPFPGAPGITVVDISRLLAQPDSSYAENIQPVERSAAVHPSSLAYVIYTSGTTGAPKGVGVEHQSLANKVATLIGYLNLGLGSRYALLSSISFDPLFEQVFCPLCAGAACVVIPDAIRDDSDKFAGYLAQHRVSVLDATPALMEALLVERQLPEKLDALLLGGDVFPIELAKALHQAKLARRIMNFYGPTEACIDATAHVIFDEPSGIVPIGKPLANYAVYLLDQHLELVPAGVPGEIYIGGPGLARGYLNKPETTAERFIPDPLSHLPGCRLYRSGDLGMRRRDGTIEFLGRNDRQVQVRGIRVEVAEIEAALSLHPEVRQAVVLATESGKRGAKLAAYVVSASPVLDSATLRKHLREMLPEFMVPAVYIFLEHLPLNANGKIDFQALLKMEAGDPRDGADFVPPQGHLEKELGALWQSLLGLDRISIFDNFFDLGGHSLLLLKVLSAARNLTPKELSLADLFRYPTIASLAEFLSARGESPVHEDEHEVERLVLGRRRAAERLKSRLVVEEETQEQYG